jgi:hypothetical protein
MNLVVTAEREVYKGSHDQLSRSRRASQGAALKRGTRDASLVEAVGITEKAASSGATNGV